MSLINQVLRDLDRRHAVAGPAPAAVKTSRAASSSSNALRRAGRWGVGAALTAAAVVIGGVAQGSLSWPRSAAAVTPMPAPAPAPVVAVVAPAAVAAVPVAPSPAAARASDELRFDTSLTSRPIVQALASPTTHPAVAVLATPPPRPAKKQVADSATALLLAAPPRPEARIDKYSAARTPQERAEAEYQRGVTAHQAGKIDESADAFKAALHEDSSYVAARQAQAGVLIGQSRLDEAQALLQEGLTLSPAQPALSLMLARLQAEHHDLARAADTLKAALPNATRNAEYRGYYAAILQRANRHAEAAEQFSAALRLVPANSVWWMGLGISLAADGQAASAREAFTRAKAIGALPPEAGQYVELRLRQLM